MTAAALMAGAISTQAVDYSFEGTVVNGPLAGTVGTGSFSFDETLLDGAGDGLFDPTTGLTLTFTIFGQNFTEFDDVDFDDFPELLVLGGVPFGLDFLVVDHLPTDINEPTVLAFATGELFPGTTTRFVTDVEVEYYPVPDAGGSLALLLLSAGALGACRGFRRA